MRLDALDRVGRDYRVAFTSCNALAIASAVLTDLAVGFLPESALQPGMLVIAEDANLPRLPDAEIALLRASHAYGGIYDALGAAYRHQHGQSRYARVDAPIAAE